MLGTWGGGGMDGHLWMGNSFGGVSLMVGTWWCGFVGSAYTYF
jgi:hypothetical protein